jgi:predicted nucleic acid-binding protein
MNGKPFFDTNVLLYAAATDEPRTTMARGLLSSGGKISVQVLKEFASVFRGKFRKSWSVTEATLAEMRALLDPPLPLTIDTHESAVALAGRYGLNFYDALIVASAAEAECQVLLSEDMADGMTIGGVMIRNLFRAT